MSPEKSSSGSKAKSTKNAGKKSSKDEINSDASTVESAVSDVKSESLSDNNVSNGAVDTSDSTDEVVVKAKKVRMPKVNLKGRLSGMKKLSIRNKSEGGKKMKEKIGAAKTRFKALPPKKQKVVAVGLVAILLLTSFFVIFSGFLFSRGKAVAYAPVFEEGDEWIYRNTMGLSLKLRVYDEDEIGNGHFYKTYADYYNDRGVHSGRAFANLNSSSLDMHDGAKGNSLVYRKYEFPLYDGKTWDYTAMGSSGPIPMVAWVKYIPQQWYPRYGGFLDVFRVTYTHRDNRDTPYYVFDYAPKIGHEAEVSSTMLGMFAKWQLVGFDNKDCDNDGISNLGEWYIGTDPKNPDSDGDGIPDGMDIQPLMQMKFDFTVHEVGSTKDVAKNSNMYLRIQKDSQDIFNKQISSGSNKVTLNEKMQWDVNEKIGASPSVIIITGQDKGFPRDKILSFHPQGHGIGFEISARHNYGNNVVQLKVGNPYTYPLGSSIVPGYIVITLLNTWPSSRVTPVTWENEDNASATMSIDMFNFQGSDIVQEFYLNEYLEYYSGMYMGFGDDYRFVYSFGY